MTFQLSGMIFTGKVDDLTVIDPQNRVWAKTQNGKFQFEAERKFYSSLGSREVVIWKVVKHSFIETLYVSPFVWKMELSHVPCDTLRGIRVASGVDAGVLLCCILFIDGRSQGFF